jgi:thioredoxin reductase (NADPH)
MAQFAVIIIYSFIAFLIVATVAFYLKKIRDGQAIHKADTGKSAIHDVILPLINTSAAKGNDQLKITDFETNVRGIFMAGELGGMNTLNSAAHQAGSAVGYIAGKIRKDHKADYDLVIVGAGPAGISASLAAKMYNLRFILLEQETLAVSITSHPRQKVIINGDLHLPLAGAVKLKGTNKSDLINAFHQIVVKHRLPIQENCRVESIIKLNNSFNVISSELQNFTTAAVLLTIGKRGSPRKLNVPGESKEKVSYTVPDTTSISGKRILIVGGSDTAVESALLLAGKNQVTISYGREFFSGLTPLNSKLIGKAKSTANISVMFRSRVMLIEETHVILASPEGYKKLSNDLVFIFNGGDSAEDFLERAGVSIAGVFAEEYHCQ